MTKTSARFEFTEQQFLDYIYCPYLYEMKHESSMPTADPLTLSRLLAPIGRAFCLELMNGRVRSTDWLKQKWDAVCRKYPGYLTSERTVKGISAIVNLFRYARKTELCILDVDSPYTVHTDRSILDGHMDNIAIRNGRAEAVIFDWSQKPPNQTELDMNLKYTLDYLAFRTIYGKELAGIRIVHVRTGTAFYTMRMRDDYQRLEKIVDAVGKAIQLKLFYPRPNVLCPQCPQLNICKAW